MVATHPHRYLLALSHVLQPEPALAQRAWAHLNDGMRTCACLLYRPEVVACAAVWLAARALDIALPESPPWWSVVDASLDGACAHVFVCVCVVSARTNIFCVLHSYSHHRVPLVAPAFLLSACARTPII